MITPLSENEKKAFADRFSLLGLSRKNKQVFNQLMFDYLDEFPVLNAIARDVINHGILPIHLGISKMVGALDAAGIQVGNFISFDKEYWRSSISTKEGRQELASTFWHEVLHYVQQKKLPQPLSKRSHMAYRQFIEAEAQSISKLIDRGDDFEQALLAESYKRFQDKGMAQKYYLGLSTRLLVNADRELAKREAKSFLGNRFDEKAWYNSEYGSVKYWKDFYYKYHTGHITGGLGLFMPLKKFFTDKYQIKKIEDYYSNKYGMNISLKASISKDVIKEYNMPDGIENTILVDVNDNKDIFDFSKWRKVPKGDNKSVYVLELPNMDKDYVSSLRRSLWSEGVHASEEMLQHSDGMVIRCLMIDDNSVENVNRFFDLCGVQKKEEVVSNTKQETVRPPVPPKPLKQVNLKRGMATMIDPYHPPILKIGADKKTTFDLAYILNKKRIDFLKQGGIMLLGRNPLAQGAKIPAEVRDYQGNVKAYQIGEMDGTVSNAQGYIYLARDGQFYYKDCSMHGTHLLLRQKERALYRTVTHSR